MLLQTLGQGSGGMTAISWQVRKGGQLLSTPEPVYATWKHLWSYSHYWPSTVWATYQKNLTSIFFTWRQVQKKPWYQLWCFLRGSVTMWPQVHGCWGDAKSFWPRCAPLAFDKWAPGEAWSCRYCPSLGAQAASIDSTLGVQDRTLCPTEPCWPLQVSAEHHSHSELLSNLCFPKPRSEEGTVLQKPQLMPTQQQQVMCDVKVPLFRQIQALV